MPRDAAEAEVLAELEPSATATSAYHEAGSVERFLEPAGASVAAATGPVAAAAIPFVAGSVLRGHVVFTLTRETKVFGAWLRLRSETKVLWNQGTRKHHNIVREALLLAPAQVRVFAGLQ
jgi:hypothetical protein